MARFHLRRNRGDDQLSGFVPDNDLEMAFALWIDDDLAWAQGTHEYRPMGVAVIAASDLFSPRAFSPSRRGPPRESPTFAGLFASIGDMNAHLMERVRRRSRHRKKNFRLRSSYSPPYI